MITGDKLLTFLKGDIWTDVMGNNEFFFLSLKEIFVRLKYRLLTKTVGNKNVFVNTSVFFFLSILLSVPPSFPSLYSQNISVDDYTSDVISFFTSFIKIGSGLLNKRAIYFFLFSSLILFFYFSPS